MTTKLQKGRKYRVVEYGCIPAVPTQAPPGFEFTLDYAAYVHEDGTTAVRGTDNQLHIRKVVEVTGQVIAVDLDGTLAECHGFKGIHHIGKPIEPMVARVKQMLADGHEVWIYTARLCNETGDMAEAGRFINDWVFEVFGRSLPMTATKSGRFDVFYDDRAVTIQKNTGKILSDGGVEKDTPSIAAARDIIEEYNKAAKAWPPFNSAHEGHSILREELDELWDLVKVNQTKHDKEAMYREACQVAAMALRFMVDVCKKETK